MAGWRRSPGPEGPGSAPIQARRGRRAGVGLYNEGQAGPHCAARELTAGQRKAYMSDVVIVAALRTAVGKFNGSIAKVAGADLGAQVIKALLAKSGVKPEQVSEVLMGQVLTAGI